MRKIYSRIAATLMAAVMLFCALPSNILMMFAVEADAATADPIYVLAGGDFQQAGDHTNSAENVNNILTKIYGAGYEKMDGFLFVGDYDCETHNDTDETNSGISALMTAVQSKYSNLNYDNTILAQGNHDAKVSNIDATGGHDFTGYSVYVLNEDDYPNGGGSQSSIQSLADNLNTWLNDKLGEGYDAPVFIVSHLPLAFTPRTVTQGDAMYAKLIFDVLNTAADNGLNIIFMHGHDHAYGPDNYMGGEAIYLPKGDKIAIAELGSQSAYTWETLNFTYMNAGYTGYYSDPYTYVTDAGTDKLTMTVFKIEANQVTVERYSANGQYNMKSAGYDGSYSNTSVTNQSLSLGTLDAVYASPQTITLQANTNEIVGTNGNWIGVPGTATDDVTTSNKGWVEIIEPVEGTTTGGTTVYNYTLDTNGIDTSNSYIIVNGTSTTVLENNGTNGVTTATITSNNGTTATASTQDYEWKIDSSNRIYTTINNQTYYLRVSSGDLSLTTSTSNYSGATKWTISNSNGSYTISYKVIRTYYLTTSGLSTDSGTVRLYYADGSSVVGGTTTEDQNGTYGKIVGQLTFTVPYVGYSEVMAMDALKAQIDGYYYEAMSTPGSDVTGTKVNDSALIWEWVDTYDGNTAGDYAVNIYYEYNGTKYLLGTAEVVVPTTTTYYIAEGNGMYYVDMNTTDDDAMEVVKAGVTVSSATDANGTGKTAISDDAVTWNWVDTYNGADSGPYTVEILYNGTSLGTVEVKVNVKYETGLVGDWIEVGEVGATGGTHTYTLDTDGIDSDGQYIIVAEDDDLALHTSGSSAATAPSVYISGTTLTTTTRDYEYYWNSTYGFTRDGYNGLYQSSYAIYLGEKSASYLDGVVNHGDGTYTLYDNEGNVRGLTYSSGWTVAGDEDTYTSYKVRLYKYTGTTGGTGGGTQYAKLEGNTVYTVEQGTSRASALAAVKAGITGYVSMNADGSDATELEDSALTWKWKNTYVSSVTGSYWVEISYNGVVLGTVEVQVKPGVINNYPEYPDEGAVKVNKTATGIDFQSSGIAQVEISASGVPIKKGVDVIIMLDTSSSMESWCVECKAKFSSSDCDHDDEKDTYSRAAVLEASLVNLIKQFKTPGDDGQLLDIDVAIADFNGFYGENQSASGTAYDRDAADMMSDDIYYNASSEAKVYTNDTGALDATAFIPAADLENSYTLNYASGTNYDYAMDAIYQMATAKKEANGSEERDLFVIFLSDGAPMQWNYYHSQGASSLWNSWITGAWSADDLTTTNLNCTTHAYYYDEVDGDGDGLLNEHRMANAIKGDPNKTYEVIRKTSDLGTPTGEENMYMVNGLGATMFAISFGATDDDKVTADSMHHAIDSIATPQGDSSRPFHYHVDSADELASAFTSIGTEIAYAASNARFVDQMGSNFNLQLEAHSYLPKGETDESMRQTISPVVEIFSYDIYTLADAQAGAIPEGKNIGDRKGTKTLLEVVKFSDDGTKAYSNLIDVDKDGTYGVTVNSDGTYTISDTDDNILHADGLIYAKTFLYNTTAAGVAVTGVNIPTGINLDGTTSGNTNVVPAETFYWKLGTVQTTELAMRYYVYLEGSMEGEKNAGSYATNKFATLYYDNYLGNTCLKETVSPVMAWESANVSYAFYLVDADGNIIVNQTTGATGSFANKIAVTNPVVYEEILLNNTDQVSVLDVKAASDDVLPKYYTLYDSAAVYQVTINSNSTGAWVITKGETATVASTYVTQYKSGDASAYSNALSNDYAGDDYTHTVVWFAVVWTRQAHPDTVVVDFGLPVDIHVLTNDMFGEDGELAGVGALGSLPTGYDTATAGDQNLASGFTGSYSGMFGNATVDTENGIVEYKLEGTDICSYEKFAYAVHFNGSTNAGYYYDTITVIPATTIYYEDEFVTLTTSTKNEDGTYTTASGWDTDSTASAATQDEDRPGKYSLSTIDRNNLYGFDAAYAEMSEFSMDSAAKVNVYEGKYANAEFIFYGTGFDIISMTNTTTGTILVDVYYKDANDEWVLSNDYYAMVDTYYGMEEDGTLSPNNPEALYQVPVIKIADMPYDQYKVVITVSYMSFMDHTSADGYDFYLDAIRIYNPANDGIITNADGTTDTTINSAYIADGEGWPVYEELRNNVIAAEGVTTTTDADGNIVVTFPENDTIDSGVIFIDCNDETPSITDYVNYGPNNELYLDNGQAIAFSVNVPTNVADVQIALKVANGDSVTFEINGKTYTVNTATDLYYSILDQVKSRASAITIKNVSGGILSITNIKVTHTSAPATESGISLLSMDAESAGYALMSLRSAPAVEDAESEETTAPETETEAPETETTVPETETETETEDAESDESETSDPVAEVINKVVNTVKKAFNKFFGWFR